MVLKILIKGEEAMWPAVKSLMQEIFLMLADNRGFEVAYFPTSGNTVADRIAKKTSMFASFVPKL